MTCVGRKPGATAARVIADARAWLGVDAARREADIARLPVVIWKGRTLYTIRCCGTSGKGPHDVNVPLSMAWHLVSLGRFFCPYHAGDVFGEAGTVPAPSDSEK